MLICGKVEVMWEAADPDGCVRPETFGARGDGRHDDAPALRAALARGRPVRLGAHSYRLHTPVMAEGAAVSLLGVPGGTVLLGAVSVRATRFTAQDISFDAGGTGDAALHVTPDCRTLRLAACRFRSAAGDGVVRVGNAGSRTEIRHCLLERSARHGLNIDTAGEAAVSGCAARGNGRCGMRLHGRAGAGLSLHDLSCDDNFVGLVVTTEDGAEAAVTSSRTARNRRLGVLAAGSSMCLSEMQILDGLRLRARDARIRNCSLRRGDGVGLDCSGSERISLSCNDIAGLTSGVLIGGQARDIVLQDNTIVMTSACEAGIRVGARAQGVAASGTVFRSDHGVQHRDAFATQTDLSSVRQSVWQGARRDVVEPVELDGKWTLIVPDIAEQVIVDRAPHGIDAILTTSQVAMRGRLTAVRVVDGGDGFTQASLRVDGTGRGAFARLTVADGRITGAVVTRQGNGYGAAATLFIEGDGAGALATAQIGLRAPETGRLRLLCTSATRLAPALCQGLERTAPAGSMMTLSVRAGCWHILDGFWRNDTPARKSQLDAAFGDEPAVPADRRDIERPESAARQG